MNIHISNANYFLADGARMNININKFNDFGAFPYSVFAGTDDALIADVGPFVINVDGNDLCKRWIIKESYGFSWGVYFLSEDIFDKIMIHLQSLVTVIDEDGKELYFRYYDPRVLRFFLPTCDSEQLKEFFGPIDYFLCEDEDPNYYLKFSLINNELVTERFLLSDIEIANKSSDKNDNLLNEVVNDFDLDNIV